MTLGGTHNLNAQYTPHHTPHTTHHTCELESRVLRVEPVLRPPYHQQTFNVHAIHTLRQFDSGLSALSARVPIFDRFVPNEIATQRHAKLSLSSHRRSARGRERTDQLPVTTIPRSAQKKISLIGASCYTQNTHARARQDISRSKHGFTRCSVPPQSEWADGRASTSSQCYRKSQRTREYHPTSPKHQTQPSQARSGQPPFLSLEYIRCSMLCRAPVRCGQSWLWVQPVQCWRCPKCAPLYSTNPPQADWPQATTSRTTQCRTGRSVRATNTTVSNATPAMNRRCNVPK
jgi:hypothetical protein